MKHLPLFVFIFILIPFVTLAQNDKPVIAINMDISSSRTVSVTLSVSSRYVDAVANAGGLPIVVPPITSPEDIRRYVELADGFVFVGGADMNPALYGREPHDLWNPLNTRREAFDLALMKEVLRSGKPILGVCLGMQELNVVSGGTMIQDIPSETTSNIDHRPGRGGTYLAHDVLVEPDSLLHSLLGETRLGVNSLHHQACEIIGTIAAVSARAPDGTIEGIELPGHEFALGVQWHPEKLPDDETQQAIFRGLVQAASSE